MRIAILSSIAWRTPPRQYGPWEQVASYLTEGLVEKGVNVTLFATTDSITKARLEGNCKVPYSEDRDVDPKVAECMHISHLMENAAKFDLIHNHFDFLPLTYSKLIGTPMLTTIHGFSSPKILDVYKNYNASSSCQSAMPIAAISLITLQRYIMESTAKIFLLRGTRKIICSSSAAFIPTKALWRRST